MQLKQGNTELESWIAGGLHGCQQTQARWSVLDIMYDHAGILDSIPGNAAAELASEVSRAAADAEKEKLRGNEQLKQGNTELAYGSYSRAIALAPDQAVYYGNRAAAAITLKHYKQAVADGLKVHSHLIRPFTRRCSHLLSCPAEIDAQASFLSAPMARYIPWS